MRTLWNVTSFLAVVHLLALVMVGAWLWRTERIDGDRVESIRTMLSLPVDEAAEVEAEAQEAAAAEAEAAAEVDRRQDPPLASEARLAESRIEADLAREAVRRVNDVAAQRRRELDARAADLAQREAEFEARKAAWEQAIEAERSRIVDEQFQQTVSLYESVPPKTGKTMMLELVAEGETGRERAVRLLDAMSARIAGKLIAQFKTPDEARLANELLEELRTLGQPEAEPETPADDDAPLPTG